MSSRAKVASAFSILLAVLCTTGCDQTEPTATPHFEPGRTVIGSWAEGEWVNAIPLSDAPEAFQVSGDQLFLGNCSFKTESLLTPIQKQAYLVLTQEGACLVSPMPRSVTMHRKSKCQAYVEIFASLSSVSKGMPEHASEYGKVGCIESTTDR